jgi:SAM-dependent methyltransferase
MKKIFYRFIILATSLLFLSAITWTYNPQAQADSTNSYYQEKSIHNRDGIGKFYMGREIAQVMGHQAMFWLERPTRETEERPSQVVEALALEPTDTVADLGAGTGYLSFRLAKLVPEGKVLAVDIQPEMLDYVEFIKKENKIGNVETVLGDATNPHLPDNSVDLAIMVDAYHEFEYPREMMEGLVKSLKPKGRVVLLEYRQENPLIPIKALHKMSQRQVKKEMNAVNLTWQETKDFLPQQHLMVFAKL